MARAIDAEADDDREARLALALDQNAGELVGPEQQIVRPFKLEPRPERRRAVAQRVVQGKRRHERQLRRQRLGRRLAQQQAGVEIARRRVPGAAAPAAAGQLAARRDPQRPAPAGACTRQRLGIGRAENFVSFVPDPRQARGFAVHLSDARRSPRSRVSKQGLRRRGRSANQRRRIDEEQHVDQPGNAEHQPQHARHVLEAFHRLVEIHDLDDGQIVEGAHHA